MIMKRYSHLDASYPKRCWIGFLEAVKVGYYRESGIHRVCKRREIIIMIRGRTLAESSRRRVSFWSLHARIERFGRMSNYVERLRFCIRFYLCFSTFRRFLPVSQSPNLTGGDVFHGRSSLDPREWSCNTKKHRGQDCCADSSTTISGK